MPQGDQVNESQQCRPEDAIGLQGVCSPETQTSYAEATGARAPAAEPRPDLGLNRFAATGTQEKPKGVTFLHLNDFHGALLGNDGRYFAGGAARMTTAIAQVAEENQKRGYGTVVLIAGDVFTGGIDADGMMVIETLKKMQEVLKDKGVQFVATLGNHEFDYGMKTALKYIKEAGFPVLGGNIEYRENGQEAFSRLADPSVTIDVGGAKVKIVGLTTPDSVSTTQKEGQLVVHDPVSAANSTFSAVEGARPDVTVLSTHMPADNGLAEVAFNNSVDAVMVGHRHPKEPQFCAESYADCSDIAGVPFCSVPADPTGGAFIGQVDVNLDGSAERVQSKSIPLRGGIESDRDAKARGAQVQDFIVKLIENDKKAHPERYVPIGRLASELTISRDGQGSLGTFITDAMLAAARDAGVNADVALFNSGAARENIIPDKDGKIIQLQRDLSFKYDNTLVTVTVMGQQLIDILQESKAREGKGDGMYLQHSCIPAPIDVNRSYTIVAPNYLAPEDEKKVKHDDKHTYFPEGTEATVVDKAGKPVTVRTAFTAELLPLEPPPYKHIAGKGARNK